jgi:hypothetical protein
MMSVTRNWQTRMIVSLLVLACIGVLLPSALSAQSTKPWRAEFFNNPDLVGDPVKVRSDSAINYRWKDDGPEDGVDYNHWSARWTGQFLFDSAEYLFKAYTDDGVRVWVDGQLVLDQWRHQPVTLIEKRIDISPGMHSVRVEYFDNIGDAVCIVWWERMTPPTTTFWRAEYYTNPWLSGSPIAINTETAISYDWGAGSPGPNVPADGFSVRWKADVQFASTGDHEFSATVDDGLRVWVDGQLLIDQWHDQAPTTYTATRSLTQGHHKLVIEYYENTGDAKISFGWTYTGTTPGTSETPGTSVAPATIIVDDQDSGFVKSGPSDGWFERSVGYKGHTVWTYNSNATVYNHAKWTPALPGAGEYDVYVHIPRQRADTHSAKYRIYHNGQEATYSVDQAVYFDEWVSIGTYDFAADGSEYVYLDDVTGEAYASRNIGFDAVMFETEGAASSATAVPTSTSTPWVVVVTPEASATPVVVTATPVVVTATPVVVTATPPSATVTPTSPSPSPTLPTCAIMPVLGFGNIWSSNPSVRDRLGCPVEAEQGVWSAEQTFLGGLMFWRADLSLIYVLKNDGTWQSFADTWDTSQPEWDTSIIPPAGYIQPKRGFGKVWREQPGVRDALSWATTSERGLGASWQAYQGGQMVWSDVQGNFVLFSDGTWNHY